MSLDEAPVYANAAVEFQSDGRSLGNLRTSISQIADPAGAGLVVRGTIVDDANSYNSRNGGGQMAALKLRLTYRFTFTLGSDSIYITDLTLYGDGTYDKQERWTQQ